MQIKPGKPADRLVKEERAQLVVSCVSTECNISIGTARWVGGASLDRAFVQNMPHARAGESLNEVDVDIFIEHDQWYLLLP